MRGRGTCHYCGQIRDVVVGENAELTQEEIDKLAADQCDCYGAKTQQKLDDDASMTEKNIDELLSDSPAADILKKCIPLIQHSSINGISIQLNETTKVSMGTTTKGALKVTKTTTIKQEKKAE